MSALRRSPRLSKLAASLSVFGLGATLGTTLGGCDDSWDFECTAIWGVDNIELSKKIYKYPALRSEQDATARCKKEMMENKPRDANSATCKCVGT